MPSLVADTLDLPTWISDLELARIGLSSIDCASAKLNGSFLDVCARVASLPSSTVLLSGGKSQTAEFNIVGLNPWLTIRADSKHTHVTLFGNTQIIEGDPLAIVEGVIEQFSLRKFDTTLPFAAGLMGYFAYDLKDRLEDLPRTSIDDLELPDLYLSAPSTVLVQSLSSGETWICQPQLEGLNKSQVSYFERCHQQTQLLCAQKTNPDSEFKAHSLEFGIKHEDFVSSVAALRKHIAAGDVFQVNLSHRMQAVFEGNPFSLFLDLFEKNPAPFFSYVNAGDHQIISSSPERFLKLQNGIIEARPIKGTSPRGQAAEEDQANLEALKLSAKDNAELTMIVDLLRNDLAKVCLPGSIDLQEHRLCESYQNVHHSLSIISGVLEDSYSMVDLVRSTFPSGSITGCPKLRAMELIDEYEPTRRHIYCGSIGYLSFHNTMDLNVAIRTATIKNRTLFCPIGAGIVFDSDAESEYQETLDKGRTFLGEVSPTIQDSTKNKLWCDGRVVCADSASIPLLDTGVQYGIGLFETIRAENGVPWYLPEHIARFQNSWSALFDCTFPDISWADVINQVLIANNLCEQTASIKIQSIAKSTSQGIACPYHLAVSAKANQLQKASPSIGLALKVYPEPRQTPLAAHKTLNYMYYDTARSWAQSRGADQAVILNPDESVSETNCANILLIKNDMVIRPKSAHVLPGIMEAVVCKHLSRLGYDIWQRQVFAHDLPNADAVILTNSLIGVQAAASIDRIALGQKQILVEKLQQAVFA